MVVNEENVKRLLEVYTLEEILEEMDISPEEVIVILVENGYVEPLFEQMPLRF